ncbi:aminopeptidase N-like [Tubulanus polymorphus]|uniref:aminopeptidase N-like n=1 Tax=Tubulanus polymorphus TaxID=672921 RepID=UPI003DA5EA87
MIQLLDTSNTDLRLPRDLEPVHYVIELRPDIYSNDATSFRFHGFTRIYFKCLKPTDLITFHILNLEIDNSTIKFGANNTKRTAPSFKQWRQDSTRQFFIGELDKKMKVGRVYFIEMKYSAPLITDYNGLYLSPYTENAVTKYMATSKLSPTYARKAFPCFDEPQFKATFDVTLRRKNPMNSLSNSHKLSSSKPDADGWIDDVFATTPVMSTYLLAFVVSEFKSIERKSKSGTTVRIWTRPQYITYAKYADSIAADILEYHVDYFKVDFPLQKMDLIAIPQIQTNAMENWGLITFRESTLLCDVDYASQDYKIFIALVISHELSHQWFGNLVTASWWDDLWLTEGFATYVSYAGVHHVEPRVNDDEKLLIDTINVLRDDSLSGTRPIYAQVNNPSEISSIFDSISYGKASRVIRMMNMFLGPKKFKKGITKYIKDHKYSAATHDDLLNALTEASREKTSINVSEIMLPWIKQKGYPVVTIERDQNAPDTANVRQERFLLYADNATTDSLKWHVPLTFTTNESTPNWSMDKANIIWMNQDNTRIGKSDGYPSDPSTWIIANIAQCGYYRVNYDQKNWKAIIQQLKNNHKVIDSRNRVQLIDDAFYFVRAEILDMTTALELSEYMKDESEYFPWKTYIDHLIYIDPLIGATDLFWEYSRFMAQQLSVMYDKLGWLAKETDSFTDTYLRTSMLDNSCYYGLEDCIAKVSSIYANWMADPENNPIDPNSKFMVISNAIRNGGQKEWDFLFDWYRKSTNQEENKLFVASLGYSNDTSILNSFLNQALDLPDTPQIMRAVGKNPKGSSQAWKYFVENWDTIFTRYKDSSPDLETIIGGVTTNFNTEQELNELETFIGTHPDQASYFDTAVKQTKSNILWMQTNEDKIRNWLNKLNV